MKQNDDMAVIILSGRDRKTNVCHLQGLDQGLDKEKFLQPWKAKHAPYGGKIVPTYFALRPISCIFLEDQN